MKFPEVSFETRTVLTVSKTLVLKECHVEEILRQWAIACAGFTKPSITTDAAGGCISCAEITETEAHEL
jgi:hypothetical protein